jgi:2-polyprenyl-3-methyl-5-hydroxy-6-metoxy-1,4-benzoquinol methylase
MSTSLKDLIAEHGEWTAMAVKLPDGSYTRQPAADFRLKRLVQVASDLIKKPIASCRVLDLACLEGHYGLEFALHGAAVVGIEGRVSNIAKAEFASRAYGLSTMRLIHGDVRSLSREQHGSFDIIICSGILYHLTAPDAWKLIQNMFDVCEGIVLIDTFIALTSQTTITLDAMECHGLIYPEHEENASAEQKTRALWASLDNPASFWFTEPTLMNLIAKAGFSTCVDVLIPHMPNNLRDRKTYCALKGQTVKILSSDPTDRQAAGDISEGINPRFDAIQKRQSMIFRFAKRVLPTSVKSAIKPALRALRIIPPDSTPDFMRKPRK